MQDKKKCKRPSHNASVSMNCARRQKGVCWVVVVVVCASLHSLLYAHSPCSPRVVELYAGVGKNIFGGGLCSLCLTRCVRARSFWQAKKPTNTSSSSSSSTAPVSSNGQQRIDAAMALSMSSRQGYCVAFNRPTPSQCDCTSARIHSRSHSAATERSAAQAIECVFVD